MFEQKLIVGRYLTLPNPVTSKMLYQPGDFVTQALKPLRLAESTGVFTKTSQVQTGTNATKAWRNFQWLAWYPCAISQVAINGVDVLTGPMSGCWLMIYNYNGHTYAGHIGTDMNKQEGTATLKQAWNNWAVGHQADVIGGFNPARHWTNNFPAKVAGDNLPKIFGLMTTGHKYFSILLYTQKDPKTNSSIPERYRIAGVHEMMSANFHDLSHI